MIPLLLWSGKVLFLVALYGFILFVMRAAIRDMRTVETSRFDAAKGSSTPGDRVADGRKAGSGEDQVVWQLKAVSSPCLAEGHVVLGPRKGRVILGRGAEADVLLSDTFVSSQHASIERGDGGLVLLDLGSTNGTILNGVEIEGQMLLEEGDRVEIGDTVFKVEVG